MREILYSTIRFSIRNLRFLRLLAVNYFRLWSSICGFPLSLRLLDAESPWRNAAPKYIRATKFVYSYTKLNE